MKDDISTRLTADFSAWQNEYAIAKALCKAANYDVNQLGFEDGANTGKHTTVCVRLAVEASASESDDGFWTRSTRDLLRLCVDRAAARVYPQLDTLQYVETPIAFEVDDVPVARLYVVPSSSFFPLLSLGSNGPQRVEDVGDATSQSNEKMQHRVDGVVHISKTVRAMDSEGAGVGTTFATPSLQMLRQQQMDSSPLHSNPLLDRAESVNERQLIRARWRVARLLTERLFNEASWCRPARIQAAGPRRGGRGGGGRQLHAAPNAAKMEHSSVVKAATSAAVPPEGSAVRAPFSKRFLHVDCNGIEIRGVVVARSKRYAYVAVPHSHSASQNPSWVVLTRIPVPVALEKKVARTIRASTGDAANTQSLQQLVDVWSSPSRGKTSRKRERSASADEDASSPADFHTTLESLKGAAFRLFPNLREVALHDDTIVAALPPSLWYPVSVVAHKIFCKATSPHSPPSPQSLSMLFEDSAVADVDEDAASALAEALLGMESGSDASSGGMIIPLPLATSPADWAEWMSVSAKAVLSLTYNTFSDVVSLVELSCSNFLERRLKSVTDVARGGKAKGRAGGDSSDGTRTKTTEQLNASVSQLFTGLTDTMSVFFRKLRGASSKPLVQVKRVADLETLEEGPTVEFKAKVTRWQMKGAPREAGEAQRESVRGAEDDDEEDGKAPLIAAAGFRSHTTDTERLRHTVAAMASTLGGVVAVGVTDDGRVVGVPHGALRAMRLTGFCPATVKDAVTLRQLTIMQSASSKATGDNAENSDSGAQVSEDANRIMPTDWWKAGSPKKFIGMVPQQPTAATTGEQASLQGGPGRGNAASQSAPKGEERMVVVVLSVMRGSAPFYSPSKNALPSSRGCASTVPLTALACAKRLVAQLPPIEGAFNIDMAIHRTEAEPHADEVNSAAGDAGASDDDVRVSDVEDENASNAGVYLSE